MNKAKPDGLVFGVKIVDRLLTAFYIFEIGCRFSLPTPPVSASKEAH